MEKTRAEAESGMEQYLLMFLTGQATVAATKCSLYSELATSPQVKQFFTTQRGLLEKTVKRLRNLLEPQGAHTVPATSPSDLDLLLDWHKDTMASGSSYFSCALQITDTKLEHEFLKQATASKLAERETRTVITQLGGSTI